MVDVHKQFDDEQAEMHTWPPAHCCCFGLEHVVPIHPIFEPCPLNTNVARWRIGLSSSHLPVLEYTDVDHCGWMIFIKPRTSSRTWSITNVKAIFPKTWKLFCCRTLSDGIVSIHGANISGCFRPFYWIQREGYVENIAISTFGTPFSSVRGSTHYLKMTFAATALGWGSVASSMLGCLYPRGKSSVLIV